MGIKLFNLPDRKDRYSLGKLGEEIVALLLIKQGYLYLESNFRGVGFEVDLIMQKDDRVVAFEVKTTKTSTMEYLYESIRPQQINRLLKGTQNFCFHHKIISPIKVEAALVNLAEDVPKIEILPVL